LPEGLSPSRFHPVPGNRSGVAPRKSGNLSFALIPALHRIINPKFFAFVKNDPDLSVVAGYDVLPFDIDHHSSPCRSLACTDILEEWSD
jgi:hypothetical protein